MPFHAARRQFLALIGSALVAWSAGADAQQASGKIPRIGVLWHAGSAEEEGIYFETLRKGLRDLGYVEGQTIALEHRFPDEQYERFFTMAAELAALRVDVLVAAGRLAALAVQRATTSIPIVFIAVPDPVGSKLVTSLANPGGNITGVSNFARALSAKRLEFLKLIEPNVTRVGLLINANDPIAAQHYIEESQNAAERLKLVLQVVEIRTANDLIPAFSRMSSDRVNGVAVSQDGLFYARKKEIADLARAHRLPMVVYSRETVAAGALISYGPNNSLLFYRAATYVDKILKGAKPSKLPVEQPTKFEFILNLNTARALGIDVPQTLLSYVDEVIE